MGNQFLMHKVKLTNDQSIYNDEKENNSNDIPTTRTIKDLQNLDNIKNINKNLSKMNILSTENISNNINIISTKSFSNNINNDIKSLSIIPQEIEANNSTSSENSSPSRKSAKSKSIIQSKQLLTNSSNYERDVLTINRKFNRQYEDKDLIEECIHKHFFMKCLEKQARLEIIREMTLAYVPENTVLFSQGFPGNYFYIVKEGKASVIVNGKLTHEFTRGDSFGELALLHNSVRSGTVITVTQCYLWVLERKDFKKIVDHIAKLNFEESKTFIQSIPIFANFGHIQTAILCESLIKVSFESGKYIVKEGESANCIYIIKEGEVICKYKNTDKIIRTLKRGDYFGERSILVDSNRTMDVLAKTNCICYSISTSTLKNMLGENFRSLLYLNFIKSAFATSKYFQKFNLYLVEKIFLLFEAVNLSKNSIAFHKNYKKSENIVVIIDGNLVDKNNGNIIANRGSILFEEDLYYQNDEIIDYDLSPDPDCLFLIANSKKVLFNLQMPFEQAMQKNEIMEALSKIYIFRNIPLKKLENITMKIGIRKYSKNEIILSEGEIGKEFYIVKKGKIDIEIKGKYIRTLSDEGYFGGRSLLLKEPRSATAISKSDDCELFYLSREDFENNIEENLKQYLMNKCYLQDESIELENLKFIKPLGSGNYGSVSLVASEKTNYQYAIKSISRKHIDYEQLHQNISLEKKILLQLDNPFIVKLVKTLKDDKFIYFLMEYVHGRELFDVIREIGLLSKEQSQFYGGCMLLAIEYLHEKKFIYRDLKPENIMVLFKNGYIKLIDFGTAKEIADRTSTIIGTPHYMAPEIILGRGYSFQVDVWSIAVCLFEFMCGGVPFGENAEDPMNVYISIINDKLCFPVFCKDKCFKQLMIHMLAKTVTKRYTKINQIKNHVWFHNFNWDELESLNMKPAYLPKEKNNKFISDSNNDYIEGRNNNNNDNKDIIINNDSNNLYGIPYKEYVDKYCKEWKCNDNNKLFQIKNCLDSNSEQIKIWYDSF